jgi:hypothetical protein
MNSEYKIPSTDEAWESGELGEDEAYVSVYTNSDLDTAIDNALGLKAISIRLQVSLIEDLRMIGTRNGIGYQTLVRQILTRFAECEKKQILRELLAEQANNVKQAELVSTSVKAKRDPVRQRKTA